MTVSEMHVMFRQYAQQMGMQNVRAILPEQIDLLLNTAVIDIVNKIIKENIGITNDRVITDNSKIGQINALRSLYKVEEIYMGVSHYAYQPMPKNVESSETTSTGSTDIPITKSSINAGQPVEIPTAATFMLEQSRAHIGKLSTKFKVDVVGSSGTISKSDIVNYSLSIPEYMFIVDFALNYKPASVGYKNQTVTTYVEDGQETNFFPVRLIDDAYLADTLNDFILKPRLRSPIIVTYNNGTFDLYIDKFTKDGDNGYKLVNNLMPYYLRFSYIGKPAKIEYSEDVNGPNVDCDLPGYLHVDVVKHAVDLYHTALRGSMMSVQQQEQIANQENVRNNYRNDGNAQQQ